MGIRHIKVTGQMLAHRIKWMLETVIPLSNKNVKRGRVATSSIAAISRRIKRNLVRNSLILPIPHLKSLA